MSSGAIRLTAVDANLGTPVPIHPQRIDLDWGGGTKGAQLQRSVPTRICASLADVETCSETVEVLPAVAVGFDVTSDLIEPRPLWSPLGDVGTDFELSLDLKNAWAGGEVIRIARRAGANGRHAGRSLPRQCFNVTRR